MLAGVDVVSTANNHASRLRRSRRRLYHRLTQAAPDRAGWHRGNPRANARRRGVGTAWCSLWLSSLRCSTSSNGNWRDIDWRVARFDIPTMQTDVAALFKKADVVIVSMHNVWEYQPKPNAIQVEFAHAAIDAGATLVIGHHPHVTQPMEHYGRGVIFYSLGNLVFDQFQRVETQHGEIAELVFAGRDITQAGVIPVRITRDGPEVEPMRTVPPAGPRESKKPVTPSQGATGFCLSTYPARTSSEGVSFYGRAGSSQAGRCPLTKAWNPRE